MSSTRVAWSSLSRCIAVALPVSAADLLSKSLVAQWRPDALVYNTAVFAPVEGTMPMWSSDVGLGLLTIVLAFWVIRALAPIDRRAIVALGLIAGGTLGNMASLVSGPHGVADFVELQITSTTGIVANGADFALWSGTALLLPVVATLIQRVRGPHAADAMRQKPM